MNSEQLAAFIVGVAITTLIVGAVLIVLYALRGSRAKKAGGLFPSFEEGDRQTTTRERQGAIAAPEPAPYRVVEWKQPGAPEAPPPRPVAPEPVVAHTEPAAGEDVVVVTAEQPEEIRLEDAEVAAVDEEPAQNPTEA